MGVLSSTLVEPSPYHLSVPYIFLWFSTCKTSLFPFAKCRASRIPTPSPWVSTFSQSARWSVRKRDAIRARSSLCQTPCPRWVPGSGWVVVVRSLVLFLFRLEREAGKEDGNMFPVWWPLKGFVFCVCVSLDTYVDAYINIFTHTMYTYTYLIESVNGSSVAGVLFFVLQPCRNLGMSTYFLDSHLQVCL